MPQIEMLDTSTFIADAPEATSPPAGIEHDHFASAVQRRQAAALGMWLFLATEVLMFSGLFCLYGVFRANSPEIFHYGHQFLDVGWGLINTIVLLLSSFTMAVAVTCARRQLWNHVSLFLGLTLMCGVIFLGVKTIEYQHKFHDALLWGEHFDPGGHEPAPGRPEEDSSSVAGVAGAGAAAAEPLSPTLLRGQALYQRSCLACHGREGEGVTGAGVPLAGTPFLNERSDAEMVAFIKAGRLPSAEDSKLGQYMPPRGGNPGLRENDLAMIVAYLRTLEPVDVEAFNTGPTLPRSFIADAAQGPPGLRPEVLENPAYLPTRSRAANEHDPEARPVVPERAHLFFGLYFLTTGLHAIHLVIGMGLIGYLLLRVQQWRLLRPDGDLPIELTSLYWHLVDIIWIFVFPLYYLIH
ncbi:MAG: cytochrome c oxidase subunit 3 [Phycisphaeraceae bacterium]